MKTKDTWFTEEPLKRNIKRKIYASSLCKDMNKLGRAINNPPRCLILQALSQSPKNVGQLTKIIGISQSGISKHLGVLRNWDFVDGFKNGKQVTYKINQGYIRELVCKLSDMIKFKPNF